MDKFVRVFINDILIYSKSVKDHEDHLRVALKTLRHHHLYAKFSNYEFWLDKLHFLRHVVSKDGISVDPSKIESVSDWKPSQSLTGIRSFSVWQAIDDLWKDFLH